MSKINPDVCSCCTEIYNRINLKKVNLGKQSLNLCPECYEEYESIVKDAYLSGYQKGWNDATYKEIYDDEGAFKEWNVGG